MGKERLKRIGIILLISVLILFLGAALSRWWETKRAVGQKIQLPIESVASGLEQVSGKILGKTIEILPGTETKPSRSAETIEAQTQEILAILKTLPEEELKKIKKQIFADFCQEVMGE
jgi:hypothetical protein